jgi:uncharacterized membrane protein
MTFSLPASEPPARPDGSRRLLLPLLLAYPALAIAGDVTHRQIFPLMALLVLTTVVMLPRLLLHRVAPWLLWFAVLGLLLLSSLFGFADLLLESVPVVICTLLAIGFGRTLVTPEPLVARFIVALEGPERLALPGVARYARDITWSWTILMATQALLLTVLLLCAEHAGVLARMGIASPLPIPDRWATAWLHVGGYLVLGGAFALEYGYRRWRLRHLDHMSLRAMTLRVMRHWPEMLRGKGATP